MVKQQIICPKCFARYIEEERLLVCQNGSCAASGTPVKERDARHEAGRPHCPTCGREILLRVCPDCGFEFSGHSTAAEMLGISMVGASGVGKSHFLTVLLDRVKHEMPKVYGCSLYPLGGDNTIEQYNRRYYQPLFEEGHVLDSTTQEDVEPLIYSLVFPEGSENGKTVNMTFYDACGSNFYSEREMEESNRSIYNSKGILFLIDPSQLDTVRTRRIARGKPVCDVDPGTLLSRTIHLIRAGSGQANVKQKIAIPIAVCLTKMDIVKPWLDPSSFVGSRSRHLRRPGFDPVDFDSCNLEVISLIESWAGKDLINQVTSQFATCGFFAFSALGQEPSEDGRVQHVQPHRVMDPLLWLLYQNRMIGLARGR